MQSLTRPSGAMTLRPATEADMPAIAAIYAHHVLHGDASFEIDPPSLAEMIERRAGIVAKGLPYLVAVDEAGEVLGYAYASTYRPRPGYRHTVEDSIYLRPDMLGRGLGKALLAAIIEACTALGYRQMLAVAGGDSSPASVKLHQSMGFHIAGTLEAIGRKHGRWLPTVLLQRALGEGSTTPPKGE
ncbi:N-acetyltransferase [Acetobacteraceae bacterium H6797]|nr:N-acetyltransferase [Acetobacteraceae bacterium H6797]